MVQKTKGENDNPTQIEDHDLTLRDMVAQLKKMGEDDNTIANMIEQMKVSSPDMQLEGYDSEYANSSDKIGHRFFIFISSEYDMYF